MTQPNQYEHELVRAVIYRYAEKRNPMAKIVYASVEFDFTRQEAEVFRLINEAGDRGQSMEELIDRTNIEGLEHPDRRIWRYIRSLRRKLEPHGFTIAKRHRDLFDNYTITALSNVNSRHERVA